MTSDKLHLIVDLACRIYLKYGMKVAYFLVVLLIVLGVMVFWGLFLNKQLAHRLPLSLDGTEITLAGMVREVEHLPSGVKRLSIKVGSIISFPSGDKRANWPDLRLIRVSYYPKARGLKQYADGERERKDVETGKSGLFRIKLKAFRNFYNPVGFDYEYWALANGLDASGYIKEYSLLESQGMDWQLSNAFLKDWRNKVVAHASRLDGLAGQLVPALLFGQGSSLDGQYWNDLQLVGGVHLLVVSGLHLGFWVAGFLVLWRLIRRAVAFIRLETPLFMMRFEPWFLILLTATYCSLAGWGVSLQRAFFMMLVGIWLLYRSGRGRLSLTYAVSLMVVVLVSPLAILQPGFVFSFSAVLILMFTFSGRPVDMPVLSVSLLLKAQLVLAVGMLAVYWLFSQPQSLQGIVTNLIAVPLLGVFILPISILVFLFQADWLVELYNQVVGFLFHYLGLYLPDAADLSMAPQGWWLLPLFVIGLWLLSPKGGGFKVIFIVLLVAMVWGDFSIEERRLIVFDAGQGLAVLVSGDGFHGVYDTGAAFSSGFSVGGRVVAPNLRQAGVKELDHLVVSHGDNDHAGGLAGLARYVEVKRLISGQYLSGWHPENCHSLGEGWHLTEDPLIQWRVFSKESQNVGGLNDNNQSCVLQYQIGEYRVLMPGDIEKEVERELVLKYGEQLRSDILIAGHHGSKTSSSSVWIEHVAPDYSVVSAGFNNRFGHPHQTVLERFSERGVEVLNTAELGAVEFGFDGGVRWFGWANARKHHWNQN